MTARSSAAVLQARTLRIKSRNFIAMVGVVCEVYCIDHNGFSPTHSTPDLAKRRLITRMCSWRPLGTNESPSIYPWLARPIFLSWMVSAPCYCWSLCPQYLVELRYLDLRCLREPRACCTHLSKYDVPGTESFFTHRVKNRMNRSLPGLSRKNRIEK